MHTTNLTSESKEIKTNEPHVAKNQFPIAPITLSSKFYDCYTTLNFSDSFFKPKPILAPDDLLKWELGSKRRYT